MQIDIITLKGIWKEACFVGFKGDEVFDDFDIVNIGKRYKKGAKKLYFASYAKNVELDGWYEREFDRHKYMPKNLSWSYVVEDKTAVPNGVKYIKVDSINTALESLFKFVLLTINPKVCAITGSVGKTTTAAMIEQAILTKFKCYRIYAKRITPLILFAKIINELKKDVSWIILEMAMYHRHHIPELVRLIPPDISVILNVKDIHIGIDNIRNQRDILKNKSKILIPSSVWVLNYSDRYLRRLIAKKKYFILKTPYQTR